ncbi:3-oxoacyl-[acyl-carrier-protein] synthase III C-terminal domain-containing protein [Neotabrizicola sp. sgz301269]|uniref:3-oxoacyl-[acyl-carrier-protein] synthase III C-terminal domain-containing protein n=1 Tax=Neotabrizicola sp. sgz301269 TaxID=3276282 RepID=UPI00376FAFF9
MILAAAHALPARRVPSTEIDRRCGLPEGRTEAATGIAARFHVEGESQIDLAVAAARAALDRAGIAPAEIDLVLGANAVPYQPLPATAPLVMRGLGIADGQAAAYDLNATCLSFLPAFDHAATQIALGRARHALVFSSEIASRALNFAGDPFVAAHFGDGAAAVVLGPGTGRIAACRMRSYPSGYEACGLRSGGTAIDLRADPEGFAAGAWFHMEGEALFRLTARHFRAFLQDLLEEAGWTLAGIDLIIPHQASPRALSRMARALDVPIGRMIDISLDFGNQVAASIPTALAVAHDRGLLGPGRRVLLLGTAAGVTFGGLALET